MRRFFPLFCVLLAQTVSRDSAAPGVNLRWTDCFGDGGAQNRNFACDTNVGVHQLRGSFVLGSNLSRVVGVAPVVDLATASAVLPEWWEHENRGACRTNSLSVSAFDGTNCSDWALGQASMNIASYGTHVFSPNSARIQMVHAVVSAAVQDLVGGTEYAAFQLTIRNTATVDSPCTGCQVPACIVFVRNDVETADQTRTRLEGATDAAGTSFWVTWQGGGGVSVPGRPDGCPAATPTRLRTWGAVKALYR